MIWKIRMKALSQIMGWRCLVLLAVTMQLKTTTAYRCPTIPTCHCNTMSGMEVLCIIDGNHVQMNYVSNSYFKIDCANFALDYNKLPIILDQPETLTSIVINNCPLPNVSFGEVITRLGLKSQMFSFKNKHNLTGTVLKKHLQGLESVRRLLLNTDMANISSDLFEDLKNLTWLTIRSEKIRLTNETFNSLTQLEYLEVTNSHHIEIPSDVFTHLTSLKKLSLWYNDIQVISNGQFQNLTHLEELDLSSNRLTTLPEDVLYPLKKLKKFSSLGNKFTELPSNLLVNNKELTEFTIRNNNDNLTTLPEYFLADMPRLKEVFLTSLGLKNLPENLFANSSNILNISFYGNRLETLPEMIFHDQSKLIKLELSSNKIKELPTNVFGSLAYVEILELQHNQLEHIQANLFGAMRNLQILKINNNKLKTFHSNALSVSVESLKEIQLAYNKLTLLEASSYKLPITQSPFSRAKDLETLNLKSNLITEIFDDWRYAVKLNLLDLSYNKINYVTFQDISFVSNDLAVDISNNNISVIDFSKAESLIKLANNSYPDALHGLSQPKRKVIVVAQNNPYYCDCIMTYFVKYLQNKLDPQVNAHVSVDVTNSKCESPDYLAGQLLTTVPLGKLLCPYDLPGTTQKRCPAGCECYTRLDDYSLKVECTDLKAIPELPDPINSSLHYTELHMENLGLTEITPKRSIPNHVRKLFLNNNNLTRLELGDIPEKIEVLDLSNNNIQHMNETIANMVVNASTLKSLKLSGNPIACDCQNKPLLNLLLDKRSMVVGFSELLCPDSSKIADLNVGNLCETAPAIIVVSTLVALAGLIAGISAALYYKYNQEIKVYLFANGWCLWLVTEEEVDKDKLYDAFVSFSYKDEDFVVNKLVSELEKGPNPFKLCVHFRDWVAGELIPSQINKSVQDSKRTIVVLSPNFLQSEWGKMEFRAAHSQALREGRARVIVIIYGDIGPTDNLDPELQAYLTTNTYVRWGDPWFWKKLKYALPHSNHRRNHVSSDQNITKKKGFDDRLELINPTTPTTPPGQNTPPAHQAHANPLMNYVNNVPNGGIKYPVANGNGAIMMNGLKVNGNAKHSEV